MCVCVCVCVRACVRACVCVSDRDRRTHMQIRTNTWAFVFSGSPEKIGELLDPAHVPAWYHPTHRALGEPAFYHQRKGSVNVLVLF